MFVLSIGLFMTKTAGYPLKGDAQSTPDWRDNLVNVMTVAATGAGDQGLWLLVPGSP